MTLQPQYFLPCGDFPQAHVALAAARAEPLAVGGESNAVDNTFPGGVNRPEVAPLRGVLRGTVRRVKALYFSSGKGVANGNVPGPAPQEQPPAVGRECHCG